MTYFNFAIYLKFHFCHLISSRKKQDPENLNDLKGYKTELSLNKHEMLLSDSQPCEVPELEHLHVLIPEITLCQKY